MSVKYFCVLSVLAVVSGSFALRDSRENTGYSQNTYLAQYLKERQSLDRVVSQFENICPGKGDEIEEAITQVKECSDGIEENSETLCSIIKNHFLTCSKPILRVMEDCLPETSRDIPNLIFQSLHSGVGYICKTDGEHIFELANTCIMKTNYRFMRCERKIKSKLQQYKNAPPSKTNICDLANSMKACIHNQVRTSCGHLVTREAFTGFFDALMSPCKGVVTTNEINDVEMF